MGPTRCPETSVNNYHTTLCNYPQDHRLHQHPGGSLKSKFILLFWWSLRETESVIFYTNTTGNVDSWSIFFSLYWYHAYNLHHQQLDILLHKTPAAKIARRAKKPSLKQCTWHCCCRHTTAIMEGRKGEGAFHGRSKTAVLHLRMITLMITHSPITCGLDSTHTCIIWTFVCQK
jgi:hypothetical protein